MKICDLKVTKLIAESVIIIKITERENMDLIDINQDTASDEVYFERVHNNLDITGK